MPPALPNLMRVSTISSNTLSYRNRGNSLSDETPVDYTDLRVVDADPDLDQDYLIQDSSASFRTGLYTMRYRIAKTLLLVGVFIAFGFNFEIIGATVEDLKVFLHVNYNSVSFGLVLRNIGYLACTMVLGLILDKLHNYYDLLVSLASFLVAISNFLIPKVRIYALSMLLFFMQGFPQAIYDMAANTLIINLWEGITQSPINAMHAGFGIGAILAVQVAKPFLKFDQQSTIFSTTTSIYSQITFNYSNITTATTTSNYSNITTTIKENKADKVDLTVPYTIAASLAVVFAVLFIIAQGMEMRNTAWYKRNKRQLHLMVIESETDSLGGERSTTTTTTAAAATPSSHLTYSFLQRKTFLQRWTQRLVFNNRPALKPVSYVLSQIGLLVVLFMCISGNLNCWTKFMLTYLVKGPSRFSIQQFAVLESLFWLFFIISRFVAVYLGYKMNPIKFYFGLLILNVGVSSLFLLPLTYYRAIFWLLIPLVGFSTGPLIPSGFMIAKQLLVDFNSFVLSLFVLGLALGAMLSQEITGALLDPTVNASPYAEATTVTTTTTNDVNSFIIPCVSFVASLFCLIFYVPICILYKVYF